MTSNNTGAGCSYSGESHDNTCDGNSEVINNGSGGMEGRPRRSIWMWEWGLEYLHLGGCLGGMAGV